MCSVSLSRVSLRPHGLYLPGFSVHGIFSVKNTGVGHHFLLQGIFLIQGLNLCLLHWQADSLPLSDLALGHLPSKSPASSGSPRDRGLLEGKIDYLYRGNPGKIRLLPWDQIQYDRCPGKTGNFKHTHTQPEITRKGRD